MDIVLDLAKQIDSESGALVVIGVEHLHNHEGHHFLATEIVTLGDGDTRRYRITTPNNTDETHILFQVLGSLHTQVDFYEDSLVSGGIAITNICSNREEANIPNTVIAHTPDTDSGESASEEGTLLYTSQFGSDAGPQRQGGQSQRHDEFILAANSTYLLEIISLSASNLISIEFDYYEMSENKDTYTVKRV